MNEFKKRQRIKKIIYSRAIIILLIIVVLLVARGVWGIFWKYRESINDEKQLQAELASLTNEESYLASSTAELESQSGVQYDLQENFGAVLPGEKEIVIVNSATSSVPAPAPQGFFADVWSWITNW
jgi:cell division protein FtsB